MSALFIFLVYNFGFIQEIDTAFSLTFGIIILGLFYFCYHGVRQYNLAEFQEFKPSNVKASADEDPSSHRSEEMNKYQTSSLKEGEMEEIYTQINKCLTLDKIYLDPELKVHDLAKQIGVTTHNISQTINSKVQKPFYDLVNSYRVNHLKKLLSEPGNQQFTILGLGIDSGFNSKTSLNRVFKQQTGMSPSEFRRLQMVAS